MRNVKNVILALIFSSLLCGSVIAEEKPDQLAQAQKRLEDAAREYAELSAELGGDAAAHIVQSFKFSGYDKKLPKARLGVNIGDIRVESHEKGESKESAEKIQGVLVHGVSPDSPAEKAGLKAGDVITSLDGQVLLDTENKSALKQLTDLMQKVEPGDKVDVTYTRNKVSNNAAIITDEMPRSGFKMLFGDNNFDFKGPGDIDIEIEGLKGMQGFEKFKEMEIFKDMGDVIGEAKFIFLHNSPLGDAELAELSPDLGDYFGTDEGLLVVKAPSDKSIELKDGDVIKSIDGRKPSSVNHAMRILRSYQGEETVNLEILRKKRKRKVTVKIPAHEKNSQMNQWSFEKNNHFPKVIKKIHKLPAKDDAELT